MQQASGVYKIANTTNGHKYIGSSKNIKKRWKQHRRCLNRGSHTNPHIQSAWDHYGGKSFKFSVLFYCDKNMLFFWEQRCFDSLLTSDDYNMNLDAVKPPDITGIRRSEKTRKKISRGKQGKNNPMWGKEFSDTHRRRLSRAQSGENNPNYGKAMSEEQKEKIRQANLGKKHSKETREKMSKSRSGKNNPNYGKPMSDEQKAKISKTKTGTTLPEEHKRKISEGMKAAWRQKKLEKESLWQ